MRIDAVIIERFLDEQGLARFSKIDALMDILIDGKKKGGTTCVSERKIAGRWDWDRRQVRKFFDLLEELKIIEVTKRDATGTEICFLTLGEEEEEEAAVNEEKLEPKPKPKRRKPSKKEYSPEFELWWKKYPARNRLDKAATYKHWNRLLKSGVTVDQLNHALDMYIQQRLDGGDILIQDGEYTVFADPTYIKAPQNFLNGEYWKEFLKYKPKVIDFSKKHPKPQTKPSTPQKEKSEEEMIQEAMRALSGEDKGVVTS